MKPLEYVRAIHGGETQGNVLLSFKLPETNQNFLNKAIDVQQIEQALALIQRYESERESYMALPVFNGRRRRAAQIRHSRCLGLDRDDLPFNDALPIPSLTICTSPGRFQDFFRLVSPVNADTTQRLQILIADVNG